MTAAPEGSSTLDHALQLLACFRAAEPVHNASELARRLNLSRTSVTRLLVTFERHGFLERTADGRGYRVAVRAFETGAVYLEQQPDFELLRDALDDLSAKTGYTAYLGTLDGGDSIILAYQEGSMPVRFIWGVGARLPATTTALGKAILAHLPEAELDARLGRDELQTLTEYSLKTRPALDAELAEARTRGWTLVRDESHLGLTATGAAVMGRDGVPVAAISLSLLDHPPDPQRVALAGQAIQDAAAELSRRVTERARYGPRLFRRLAGDASAPASG